VVVVTVVVVPSPTIPAIPEDMGVSVSPYCISMLFPTARVCGAGVVTVAVLPSLDILQLEINTELDKLIN
jgi:preprotein translocase subunit SecB